MAELGADNSTCQWQAPGVVLAEGGLGQEPTGVGGRPGYGVSSSGPSRVAACLPGRRTLLLLEARDEDWYQV